MAAASKITVAAKFAYRLRDITVLATIRSPSPNVCSSITLRSVTSASTSQKKNKQKQKQKLVAAVAAQKSVAAASLVKEKRRTRSDKEFDKDLILRYVDNPSHIPVMLAEVLDVFSSTCWRPLHSFVDCTLGSGGYSSAIINAHPELKFLIGMDVDPVAHEKAQTRINFILHSDSDSSNPASDLKVCLLLKNFRHIKSAINETGEEHLDHGVDGILMDLGMSSMQVDNPERGFSVLCDGPLDLRMDPRAYDKASFRAEDILNSWPSAEVGRILREYGEENNWRTFQNKIVEARSHGGLHSTSDLVDLIKRMSHPMKGGRQGWIKTATRVFQALRIAVNDELNTLKDSLNSCFECLAPGGRLAVISFHSLEDRIVKQAFLDIVREMANDIDEGQKNNNDSRDVSVAEVEKYRLTANNQ